MAFDTKLAPVGQIRLPFPTQRNDFLTFSDPAPSIQLSASRGLDSSLPPVFNGYQINALSEPLCSNASSTQPKSMSGFVAALNKKETPNRFLSSTEESVIQDQRTKHPLKHDFQFIEIHEASGKANSATESHIKSHLMRKYHENRRRARKTTPRKSKAKGCQHFGVFIAQQHISAPFPMSSTRLDKKQYSSDFQSIEQNLFQTMNIRAQRRSIIQNQDTEFRHDSSRRVICYECGELMLQVSSGDGQINLLAFPGSVSSVTSTFDDPFDSLAIPVSHRMHSMIYQFIFYHALKTNPPIYSSDGLPGLLDFMSISMALGDAAAIHAMVATSLYHVALLRIRGSASPDWRTKREIEDTKDSAHRHVMQAVSLLNKKFDNPKESLSVTSLICAAMLGACTSFSGDKDHIIAHHNGILKMVETRGGIDTIPRGLAHQISRSDTLTAWQMKTKPMLPMYKSRFLGDGSRITTLEIINPVPEAYLSSTSYLLGGTPISPFSNDLFERFLCEKLFSIACNLHAMTHVLEMVSRQPSIMGPLQREAFEDTYAASKHALSSFPSFYNTEVMPSPAYFRQHSWSVAAIIYINCSLRTWDIASPPIKLMVSELIYYLSQSNLEFMWSDSPEVLVWILFIGATAAWEQRDRSWIMLELRRGIDVLHLESLEELEKLLMSLLYPECMLRDSLREIWKEVHA